jgi:hypothetical protein
MNSYAEKLEKQNEQLRQKLAFSQKEFDVWKRVKDRKIEQLEAIAIEVNYKCSEMIKEIKSGKKDLGLNAKRLRSLCRITHEYGVDE